MLESIVQHHTLVISESHVHVVKSSGWPKATARILAGKALAIRAGDSHGLGDALKEVLAESMPKRGTVSVLLADELVRLWVVNAPIGASRLGDIEAAAAMRFQQLFDERIANWRIAVSMAPAQPCMASAVHRHLYEQVLVATQQHGLTMTTMQPEWVAVWNKWRSSLKPGQWLGVWRGKSLGLFMTQGHQLSTWRQVSAPVHAPHDADWLQQQLQREAMRLNAPLPKQIRLCGQVPHHWLSFSASPVPCDMLGKQCDAMSLLGVTLGGAS